MHIIFIMYQIIIYMNLGFKFLLYLNGKRFAKKKMHLYAIIQCFSQTGSFTTCLIALLALLIFLLNEVRPLCSGVFYQI